MVSVRAFHRSRTTDEADDLRVSLNKDKPCFAWDCCPKPVQTLPLQFKFHLFLFLNFPLWRIFPFVSCFGSVQIQHFLKYCIHYIYFICIVLFFSFKMSFFVRLQVSVHCQILFFWLLVNFLCLSMSMSPYTVHLIKLWCSPGVNTGTVLFSLFMLPVGHIIHLTQHLIPLLCGWYTAVSPIKVKQNHKPH